MITTDEVKVSLDLRGGAVVDNATGPVTPDTGHLHISVDGTLVSMTFGMLQIIDLRPYGPART